jgi:UDP-2,4-diacetamido-2,4,6-trideoxy-beta-L-altropyranose hydrolase
MPPGPLVIRADANATIGTGHVMRCLALAQAWMDRGGEVTFVSQEMPEAVAARLLAEKAGLKIVSPLEDSEAESAWLAEYARQHEAAWIVLDLSCTDLAYQRKLKDAGLRVMVADDGLRETGHCADVILNQNLGANPDFYKACESATQLLLGPRFILLRREFSQGSGAPRVTSTAVRRILVTMGGSDPGNLGQRVLEGLRGARIDGMQVTVVAGAANPHLDLLRSAVAESGWCLRTDVTHMEEIMMWGDAAVIVAGGTLWELLYLGCPVLSYSRNSVQAGVLSSLRDKGVVRDLGCVDGFDADALARAIETLAASREDRQQMSQAGRELVDGRGAERVCEALLTKGQK